MDVRTRIRQYIIGRFPGAVKQKLSDEDSLLESGIVDSLGILDLVAFIESEFGIAIEDDKLAPEYFGNISNLVRLVEERSAASSEENKT